MTLKGIVISGKFGELVVRQKSGNALEIGELLVTDGPEKILLQAYDLGFGSQISQANLELVSGMKLEEDTKVEFLDSALRNYNLAFVKSLLSLDGSKAKSSKTLPNFFSNVREVTKEDLAFLTKPSYPLYLGKLRSGSKVVDVDIYLEGDKAFSHHILIAATTGRGKSNLASTMLWDVLARDYCGILVLDPHDEYYGRNKFGLKDHPSKSKLVYYTSNSPPPGAVSLKINLEMLKPNHLDGVISFSDAQKDALNSYHKKYGKVWIESIALSRPLEFTYHEGTLAVVRRKIMSLLDLEIHEGKVYCEGVFDTLSGMTTVQDISDGLERGMIVIVDTSNLPSSTELLIGSLITTEIFRRFQRYKRDGSINRKPVVSIFLEEAPRVIGKEVLEQGPNIFSTIAREGRKFKVGLCAITQLPSLIPREILANINTKIILGIEMAQERDAIISSSAQDLSDDSRNIASLDKGEAIVSSNFSRFAIPIKIPYFEDYSKKTVKNPTRFAELKD